jgi:hypothetical protein
MRLSRLLIAPALLLALSAGGCFKTFDDLRGAVGIATTQVANPVDDTDLGKVEAGYEIGLAVVVSYRRYCYSKPLAQLPKSVCGNRRAVVTKMQNADKKAYAAIEAARNFVKNNPTISPVSAIRAARDAVNEFTAATKPVAASL